MRYLLYNNLSGKSNQSSDIAEAYSVVENLPTKLIDITKIHSLTDFLEVLTPDDDVIIFGGDGTLNAIANELYDYPVKNDIYYLPCGTGNDFARDVGKYGSLDPFLINDYIKKLPTVTVKGRSRKFINGVGFGIDGYCCEVGDKFKSEKKQPNYTTIAIKGLLFHFKPVNATVIVDGKEMSFKKVWIAPTMYGRYYGGGMMPTPEQNRNEKDNKVSLMLFHGSSKLKTLMIFPSIFKGKHVKHKKNISIFEGKSISVRFDRPTALQIDGETVLNVDSYTVAV